MTAAARKHSSPKPTRRTPKKMARGKLALVKDEQIVRALEDNRAFERIVAAVVERYLASTSLAARATPDQMAARRRSYERALDHNDPPTDEAVAAVKRAWG